MSPVLVTNIADPEVVVLEMRYSIFENYSYLVVDRITRRAVVVDPAWEMQKIRYALASQRATLGGVLLTHAHPDHVHLAEPLAAEYSCPIWMSEEEIRASGFTANHLAGVGNELLYVGDTRIETILTPGHTPGCVCYLIGSNLFSGDVLFAEGCGLCADRDAAHAMFSSLQRLKSKLDPQTRIFPGHSYGTPPGQTLYQVLRDNIYLHFPDRDSFAAFRLRKVLDREKMRWLK